MLCYRWVKAKLCVRIMYWLRGLTMELYIPPNSNGCGSERGGNLYNEYSSFQNMINPKKVNNVLGGRTF